MSSSTLETASVFTVGAIGTVLPSLVSNWTTVIVSMITGIWVLYQLIAKILTDIRSYKKRKAGK